VELDAVERAVYDLQQGRKTDAQRGQHAWEKAQQSEKAEALAKSRLRNDIAAIKRAIYEIQESRSKEAQRRQQAWEEGERRKKEVAAREAKRKNEFNALKREVHELREAVEMLRKQLSQVQSARNTSGRN